MDKKTLDQCSIEEFLSLLSSKEPAPGGGGVAALSGAQGMALASMVCHYTIGKKKFLPFDEQLKAIQKESQIETYKWMKLIEQDKINFEPLSKAYGLPANTTDEEKDKMMILENALHVASIVPITSIEMGVQGIRLFQKLLPISSKIVISDISVGVHCLLTAIASAEINAIINLRLLHDQEYAQKESQRLSALVTEGEIIGKEILLSVKRYLKS